MIESIIANQATLTAARIFENPVQTSNFIDWIGNQFGQANMSITQADANLKKLAMGESIPIHEVMMSMEEARLTFHLATQIRTKLLDAYQEVLRMQI